ncbi:glycosyltransferase [Calothrix sp. HK-06]|nr:glycosyltransferase [Calothrix sp. HK-06]
MPTLFNSKRFHIFAPSIHCSQGGIQLYSAFFLQALQNLYPQSEYDVFLKHDIELQISSGINYLPKTHFHFTGSYPLKVRTSFFATEIMYEGFLQRPNLTIASHLHFSIASYFLKRIFGIPYWAFAHGIEAWDIQKPALKTAIHNADLILTGSSYTRERLLNEEKLDAKKVVILPNTFDSSRFKPALKPDYLLKRHKLKPKQPVILTVARLSALEGYKGYDQIIRALPQIRQVIPNIHYIIVGRGNDSQRIKELTTELAVQDCVTLAGFIPDEQLCDYYNLCDVFAMPSKAEGFGMVYLEALACGKPVLAGNQDGAISALCDGKLGALVNPDDVEEIAKTLIQILQGYYPNLLMYQPEQLRQMVIEQFGFERFQATLAMYLRQHLI